MAIDKEAVRRARESKGWSQEILARQAGVSQTTIDKIERGETKRSRFILDIADALGLTPSQLDTDDARLLGSDDRPRSFRDQSKFHGRSEQMPVFGAAEGGSGSLILDKTPIQFLDRPDILQHTREAYAVYIVGESMFPEFEPGDRALVDPVTPPIPGTTCIFFTDDGQNDKASIKRLVRASSTAWTVRQWNPADEFDMKLKEWPRAHRVVGKYSRR